MTPFPDAPISCPCGSGIISIRHDSHLTFGLQRDFRNFSLADGTYALQFDATGIVGMDFHRNRPLSTVDRDNDVWNNHCAKDAHPASVGTHVAICV